MAAGAPTEVEQRPRPIPRRATGVELIGRFEDSGFKEPPYLARRADGQVVQLAPVLYALAEEVDGKRDTEQIAEALSHRIQRGVDAAMVEMLLDEQLGRLGVVAQRDGVTAEVAKVDPLLALKFRTRVVPAGFVRAATTVFRPLFWPPLQLLLCAAFVACVVWLFGIHGISQSLRHLLYQPALLFLLVGGVIVATAFHELGHATAVRYGGAEPGVMGVGIYIVWPAFYTDITDAYRLGKWGRLRADTGGMYFNALFGLAATSAFLATGFEPLLLLVVLQTFAIVQQSLPFLRLDGYYIVSDLTGVPDMLSRIRPVLASLLPWRGPDPRVSELKPWVRVVVTAYVVTIVPLIALMFALMLVHAPRAFATAWDSLGVRWDRVSGGEPAGGTAQDVLQMAMLTLPCLGMLYTTSRVGHRTWRGAWRWSAGSTLRRTPLLLGALTALACVVFLWWPRGDYRPIAPGERGTLVGGVRSLGHVASGQAAVLPQNLAVGSAHEHGGRSRTDSKSSQAGDGSSKGAAEPGTTTSGSTSNGTERGTSTSGTLGPRDSIFSSGAPSSSPSSAPGSSPAPSSSSTTPQQPSSSQPAPTSTTPTQTTTTETTPTQTTTTETTPTQTTTTETTPTQTTTTETTPTTTTESSPQP